MSTVDYRALFVKYIQHVVSCQGVDYIINESGYSDVESTPEEWAALRALALEAHPG